MDNGAIVMNLLEELYVMITEAKWFPVGANKCIIDRVHALDIIDQAKQQFPIELAEAQRLVAARNEFIAQVRREAESKIKAAEERSRQLVDEQEVLRIAKSQSRDMMATAQAGAAELRRSAATFVDDTLRRSEDALTAALEQVTKSRAQFENAIKSFDSDKRHQDALPE